MTIKDQLDILIKDLCNSKALLRPDENAGNLLVDPVIPAGIKYWWDKYSESINILQQLHNVGGKV